MKVRAVALDDVTSDDVERWQRLADVSVEPNPYMTPTFLLAARRWIPQAGGIRFLVVEDARGMRALLPISLRRRTLKLPLAQLTTASDYFARYAPVCAPLVDSVGTEEILDALLTHLAGRRSGLPGLVELTLVPEGALLDDLTARVAARRLPLVERYRLSRACLRIEPGRDPRAHLSASKRKQIRRLTRGIERESGEPFVLRDVSAEPEAVERLLDLEAAGWKGDPSRGGHARRNKARNARWFTEITSAFREQGRLHVLAATAGDDLLYASTSIRAGDTLFGLIDTYDERYARFGPGTIGRLLEQEHYLAAGDARLFDPCLHPRYAEASALYPDHRTLVGLLLATRGVAGKSLLRVAPLLRDVVRRGRTADDVPGDRAAA